MSEQAISGPAFKAVVASLLLGLVLSLAVVAAPEAAGAGSETATRSSSAAKKKALAKCQKIKSKARRATCRSQVNQRFLPPVPVDVRDDYFAPTFLTVKSGRRIAWDWGTTNGNPHNVMLDPYASQPKGLTGADFFRLDTGQNHAINYRFTRDLTKTGTYNFYCSLHSTVMRMQVRVTR